MPPAPHPIDQAPVDLDERSSLRRAYAELEAAKGRVERDAAKVVADTRHQLITELLPVLDNLDRTLAAGPPGDPMVQGVTQVKSQLESVLRGYGLERFDAAGQRFDPRLHDAVTMTEVAEPERNGLVVTQFEAGYRAGAKVLRPAKVAVGKYHAPAPPPPPPQPPRQVLRPAFGGMHWRDDDDWF
jgi:molecular chaperone GrpE (heat shock protein)